MATETHQWFKEEVQTEVLTSASELNREHCIVRSSELKRYNRFRSFHSVDILAFWHPRVLPLAFKTLKP